MPYDGKLGAGKALFYIRFDQVGDQSKALGTDPFFFRPSLQDLRIGDHDLHLSLGRKGKDPRDLDRVGPVQGQGRDIHCRRMSACQRPVRNLYSVDIEGKAFHGRVCLYIDPALSVPEGEGIHTVHGQGVVGIALPVGKDRIPLPGSPGKSLLFLCRKDLNGYLCIPGRLNLLRAVFLLRLLCRLLFLPCLLAFLCLCLRGRSMASFCQKGRGQHQSCQQRRNLFSSHTYPPCSFLISW